MVRIFTRPTHQTLIKCNEIRFCRVTYIHTSVDHLFLWNLIGKKITFCYFFFTFLCIWYNSLKQEQKVFWWYHKNCLIWATWSLAPSFRTRPDTFQCCFCYKLNFDFYFWIIITLWGQGKLIKNNCKLSIKGDNYFKGGPI